MGTRARREARGVGEWARYNAALEAAADSPNVFELVAACGVDVRSGAARCPFHEDTKPSLSVSESAWKCHGCGASGGPWGWVAAWEGVDPLTAKRIAAGLVGFDAASERERAARDLDSYTPSYGAARAWTPCPRPSFAVGMASGGQRTSGAVLDGGQDWAGHPAWGELVEACFELWAAHARAGEGEGREWREDGRDAWRRERALWTALDPGASIQGADSLRVSLVTGREWARACADVAALYPDWGHSGPLKHRQDNGGGFWKYSNAEFIVVFPYFEAGGVELVRLRALGIEGHEHLARGVNLKGLGKPAGLFASPTAYSELGTRTQGREDVLVVCEGEPDALACWASGWAAVATCDAGQGGALRGVDVEPWRAARLVILAHDLDDKGESWARAVAQVVAREHGRSWAAAHVRPWRVPLGIAGKDANDFHRAGRLELVLRDTIETWKAKRGGA